MRHLTWLTGLALLALACNLGGSPPAQDIAAEPTQPGLEPAAPLPAATPWPDAALPIQYPVIFVRQAKVPFNFNTISDIFGNFRSYGNYYAENDGCDDPDPVDYYFGMPGGGDLMRLDPDGTLTNLTRLHNGAARDPEISFDGLRVLFSMKTSPCAAWQIYEIYVDGSGLRKVSHDETHNDLDPAYLPDGTIVFTSDRLRWSDGYENLPSAQLWLMDADGSNPRLLSNNPSGQFNPLPGSDGLIHFTQWDFHDCRTSIGMDNCDLDTNKFLLWKIASDGSREGHPSFGAHLLYDFGGGFVQARELPGAPGWFVATLADEFFTWGSGTLVRFFPDPNLDFDSDYFSPITPLVYLDENPDSPRYRDPYPTADGRLLAAHADSLTYCEDECRRSLTPDFSLVVLDMDGGNQATLLEDSGFWLWQPVEAAPRAAGPLAQGAALPGFAYGLLTSLDVALRGINCDDVTNGDCQLEVGAGQAAILRLFIAGRDPNYYDEFPEYADPTDKFLGDVPIAADGSFAVFVPANTPLTWQLLDAQGNLLVQERFYTEVAPGEVRQCNGCHAPHGEPPGDPASTLAFQNPANLTDLDVDEDGDGVPDLIEAWLAARR
ncbi:MAG: hypothetical protein HYZ26_07340 [Chloroflexi bacterium]|nr:hypothetical protein [Chloroflexota bacterium]